MYKFNLLVLLLFVYKFSMGQKVETVYLNPTDSSLNSYIIIYPPKLPWTGYMFLLPGMYQKASDVLIQTNLPGYAAQEGILTVIPTLKTGIAYFGIDSASQSSLHELLTDVVARHKLNDLKFYLGGFSIGGSCAIKYAELSIRNNYKIKPAAIFAIDSPLDFERDYKTLLRESRLAKIGESDLQDEIKYMLTRSMKEFGGTPSDNLQNYYQMSPYSFNDSTQFAIKPLVNLPIRLYTEPDVVWWLKDGVDYSGMNAFDLAAMTNELQRMGNTKIELITTINKGYRKPANKRHPHSWSIAESTGLIRWLLK